MSLAQGLRKHKVGLMAKQLRGRWTVSCWVAKSWIQGPLTWCQEGDLKSWTHAFWNRTPLGRATTLPLLHLCHFNNLQWCYNYLFSNPCSDWCLVCIQKDWAYREGVELLGFSVNRLQQGEVAGDATLGHSEKRIVVIQEEMELGVLGL